tara:strand:+ start:143 stop:556 length:414 start_codon:yes stop_codon:yes gene_type:complete
MNALKILIFLFMFQGTSITAQKLSDYKWKNRVLILSDKNLDSDEMNTALRTIKGSTKELKERDIILFLHQEGTFYNLDKKEVKSESSNIISKYFSGYVLIGKDGGIKAKHPYPLELEDLFNLIDGMPMRRIEMKSNN